MESTVSQINQIRDVEQRKALNAWAGDGFIGSVIAGTGFGKSRVGVLAAKYILEKKCSHTHVKSILICYQSAYKLKGEHYDLVICDEIHLGLSIKYRKFFQYNMYDSLLCMTATLPEEEEYNEVLNKLAPTVYTITLDKCVELGIVSPYKITCIPVKLRAQEAIDYKKINNRFIYWKLQLGNFDAFTEAKRILGNKNSTADQKRAAVGFYQTIRQRKAIIDYAADKITKFKSIYYKNVDKKILVFGGANDFTVLLKLLTKGLMFLMQIWG